MKYDFNFCLGGCVWLASACNSLVYAKYEIYPVAFLLGAGGSAMLVTSLAIIASLIGKNLGKHNYTASITIFYMITHPINACDIKGVTCQIENKSLV